MKYYIIFLQSGTVVDICSYDCMNYRDSQYMKYIDGGQNIINGCAWDEVQFLDIIV